MKRHARMGIVLWAAGFVAGLASGMDVEVIGSRVNLRAAPFAEAEVPGQVQQGDRLRVRELGDEWVGVVPPASIGFWVHADFVEDGVVRASGLNVRTGPGIAHQQVARLSRGDRVAVRDRFGDWLLIDPPEGASLWISRAYVRVIRPPPPAPPPVPEPKPTPPADVVVVPPPEPVRPPAPETGTVQRPVPVTPVHLPRAPEDLDLDPDVEQGRVAEHDGEIRRIGFLFRRPARFRLVSPQARGARTIGYLRGDEEQLAALVGQNVRVRGRVYTARNYRHPVMLADQISVLP